MPETHALIIGASLASMCAAAVLRRFVTKVTLIDRDTLPEGALARAGVPQARHVHVLLHRGWIELEQLFPGFQAQMLEAGAHLFDPALETAIRRPGGWQKRMQSGVVNVLASRDLTESTIRRLLRAMPGVEIKEGLEVVELRATADRRRVVGVRARERDGGAAIELEGDLVVDGGGRSSKALDWLRALGATPPAESVVDSFAGYSSRWFKVPPLDRWPGGRSWRAIWIDPDPPVHELGGVLFPVEGDRWVVTLFGHGKTYPPSDPEGFAEALLALASPLIAEAVALAEPVSPVASARSLVNRFRHYERASGLPAGFVAIGDSACVFNPIYGQGMTVSALAAGALSAAHGRGEALGSAGFARAFHEEQARILADPWALATGADFRYPETIGDKPPGADLLRGYGDLVNARSLDDEEIVRRTWPIFHMMRPAKELGAPGLVARILLLSLRAGVRSFGKVSPPIPPRPPE